MSEFEFPSLKFIWVSCMLLHVHVCLLCFPPASLAVVAHARSTPMHVPQNSCSDSVRVQGPTVTRRVKGGVSGLAEDLRPVSEV